MVLYYGHGAESFVWVAVFFFLPLSCVYNPLSTLPEWLQPISSALPPTRIFEGLHAMLQEKIFLPALMPKVLTLNLFYFAGAYLLFLYACGSSDQQRPQRIGE